MLQGVVDPEAKRKAIGAGFIRVFDDFARGLEQKHGIKPRFLVQVREKLSALKLMQEDLEKGHMLIDCCRPAAEACIALGPASGSWCAPATHI